LIKRIERLERYIVGVGTSNRVKQFTNDSLASTLSIRGRVPIDLKLHLNNLYNLTNSLLSSNHISQTQKMVEALKRYANNPTTNIGSELDDFLSPAFDLAKLATASTGIVSLYVSVDNFRNRKLVYYTLENSTYSDEDLARNLHSHGARLEYVEPVMAPTNQR